MPQHQSQKENILYFVNTRIQQNIAFLIKRGNTTSFFFIEGIYEDLTMENSSNIFFSIMSLHLQMTQPTLGP